MRTITLAAVAGVFIFFAGCALTMEPPAEAVLAGNWMATTADGTAFGVTFDASGKLVQITGTREDGESVTLDLDGATSTVSGTEFEIRIITDQGEVIFSGTISTDGRTLVGTLSDDVVIDDVLIIVIPSGDLTFEAEPDDDGNENDNGTDNGNANDNGTDNGNDNGFGNENENENENTNDNMNDNSMDDDNTNDNGSDNSNDNSHDDDDGNENDNGTDNGNDNGSGNENENENENTNDNMNDNSMDDDNTNDNGSDNSNDNSHDDDDDNSNTNANDNGTDPL